MAEPRDEGARRWRLVLGADAFEGEAPLASPGDEALEQALGTLYDADRKGGLGASSPQVHRWLGDIRGLFPPDTVRVLQKDAMEQLGLRRVLSEPELLETLEPDLELAATLLALRGALPARAQTAARQVVAQVVERLERRLEPLTRQAVTAGQRRSGRRRRPRPQDIDWDRTIRKNLHTWLPERRTIVPERLVGRPQAGASETRLLLLVDQSASMAGSLIYAAIFGSVLARLRSLRTRLAVFDTELVELTEHLDDPVDLLFAAQLGGGTDVGRALAWAEGELTRPRDSLVVLVSDLFEGPNPARMLARTRAILALGARVIVLLALSDRGAPAWHHDNAAAFAALGVPTFACTPDRFPELMAAALRGDDLALWAAREGLVAERPGAR